MGTITGKDRHDEASKLTQTFNVKAEMTYRARKFALGLLRSGKDVMARQELLRFACAARRRLVDPDLYMLEGIPLGDTTQDTLLFFSSM